MSRTKHISVGDIQEVYDAPSRAACDAIYLKSIYLPRKQAAKIRSWQLAPSNNEILPPMIRGLAADPLTYERMRSYEEWWCLGIMLMSDLGII